MAFAAQLLQVLLLPLAVAAGGPEVHSLRGSWRLRSGNGSVSLRAEVPGCVHTALLRRGLIQVRYSESRALEQPSPPRRGEPSPPKHGSRQLPGHRRLGWHGRGSSQASFGGCSVLSSA